jgi:hypothetical protein
MRKQFSFIQHTTYNFSVLLGLCLDVLGGLGCCCGFDDDDAEAGALGVERGVERVHFDLLFVERRPSKCLLFLSKKAFQFFRDNQKIEMLFKK